MFGYFADLGAFLFPGPADCISIRILHRDRSTQVVDLTVDSHSRLQAISKSPDGAIPSGVYGSGVFPYSLFLFLVATFFLFKELVCGFGCFEAILPLIASIVSSEIHRSVKWSDVWMR